MTGWEGRKPSDHPHYTTFDKIMKRWLLLATLVANIGALQRVDFHNMQAVDYTLIGTFAVLLALNVYKWVVKKS